VENAGGLGKHFSQKLVAAGESVVDVPPKLSARVLRVLSSGNARKNDGLDALATALWPPGATSGCLRSIPRLGRKSCDCFLKDARTWSPSVPERSQASARTPAGPRSWRGTGDTLDPPSCPHPARHTTARLFGRRSPAVGFGDPARRPGTGAKDRGPRWTHRSQGRSFRHHSHRYLWRRSHTGRQDHRDGRQCGTFPDHKAHYFASYSGTAPVEASSGEVVRHRLSLAGNRHLNNALHMVAICQARSDVRGKAYYRKKMAEGKSGKEALRCLKRRISDVVFKSLMADLQEPSCSVA
jgi:transposase